MSKQAPQWTASLSIPDPCAAPQVPFHIATLWCRLNFGVEWIHLGKQTRQGK